jgi:hypothetical protein
MTDEEIVDAVKEKHGIEIATGVYRKAHLDLVRMGREAERKRIVKWLREKKIDWCRCEDYIEAGEHLKCVK